MRRIIAVLLLSLYTLLGTGATGVLHFCSHEGGLHFSLEAQHDHELPEAPSCCHQTSPSETCHAPGISNTDDSCCENLYTPAPVVSISSESTLKTQDASTISATNPFELNDRLLKEFRATACTWTPPPGDQSAPQIHGGQQVLYH